MIKLTEIVKYELEVKPILGICIIGACITRLLSVLFSSYLILWIQQFAKNGILRDRDQGKEIYINMMLYSVVLSSFVFPFVGKFCDTYSPRKTVPFAFLFRCSTTYMFWLLDRPDTVYAYAVCVMMIIGTIIENISIDSIFNKNLPKETRGILNGVYSFAGQCGILIYSFLGGWMFDNIGPKSPFILIGFLDFAFAILVIVK